MALRKAAKQLRAFKGSIQGASGSGKTYSALSILTPLVEMSDSPGKRIAIIDTDKGAELYAPPFDFDIDDDFGVGAKINFHPDRLMEKMDAIVKARDENGTPIYGGIIIDSATHFYKEPGGILSMVDAIMDSEKARGKTPNQFTAWKTVDVKYRQMMVHIRNCPVHVIMCVRSKQEYKRDGGKMEKIGMAPEFRDGFEFEMDAQFQVDQDHTMVALKHRLGNYLDGKVFKKPGRDVAEVINEWANDGSVKVEPTPVEKAVVETRDVAAPKVEAPKTEPPPAEVLKAVEDYISAISTAKDIDELKSLGKPASVAYKAHQLSAYDWTKFMAAYNAKRATFD